MSFDLLVAFAAVALAAYVVPGPDWFVVLGQAARSRRQGVVAALGVQSGLLVHLAAAAAGVSALLLTSAEAFTVVKVVGAVYLVVLGLRSLRSAHRTWRTADDDLPDLAGESAPAVRTWAQAFVANVLNPKAALFFVAVLPQFVSPGESVAGQVALLGAVDVAVGLVWWGGFVLAAAALRRVWHRRAARVAVDATAGVALTGLGGVLVAAGRRV